MSENMTEEAARYALNLGRARNEVVELQKAANNMESTIGEDVTTTEVSKASAAFLKRTSPEKLDVIKNKKPRVNNDPKASEGWYTLRFRVSEAQRDVIYNAMNRVKEVAGIEEKAWKGIALEYVCADFLASYGSASLTEDQERIKNSFLAKDE